MISADEYSRLKRRDREVFGIEDFNEADIEAVHRMEPSQQANAFNHEMDLTPISQTQDQAWDRLVTILEAALPLGGETFNRNELYDD